MSYNLIVPIKSAGPLCGLSNHSMAYPFIINGCKYVSVLQAYYVWLSGDNQMLKKVLLSCSSGFEVLEAAIPIKRNYLSVVRKRCNYFDLRRVLYMILRAKFEQNPNAKTLLLATRSDWYLSIAGDEVIGIGAGHGLNISGLIMMELREHLAGRPRTPLLQRDFDAVKRRWSRTVTINL